MHVSALPVLPDSTLAPPAVLEKFRVQALAGLGTWICPDPSSPDTCYDDGSPVAGATPPVDSSVNLCALYPSMCAASSGDGDCGNSRYDSSNFNGGSRAGVHDSQSKIRQLGLMLRRL